MKQLTKITQQKLLLGEGLEEKLVFVELLKFMDINNIEVVTYNGKTNLSNYLKTLRLIPGFSDLISLGITRDADENKDAALQSIETALINNNLPIPESGQLGEKLSSKIFILPNNNTEGMLEDLCIQSIVDDLGISCVDAYFQCIQNQTGRQPKNMAKAKVHAWLASQIEPDKRLGEAAKAGYWNWNSPAFEPLKNFIASL
ncbi:DUF3226 domain-containing protein [Coleofasciculus sp. F4-SAH-05]|uniref:DUF3226 domain-containing protein n=1 Tax=Coleofasciculus sp. F4-SAH-05 TaxID=3069525 RepID=UPI0032F7CD2E